VKKRLCLLLTLALFTLAACSSDKDSTPPSGFFKPERPSEDNEPKPSLPPSTSGGSKDSSGYEQPSGPDEPFDADAIAEGLIVHQYSYTYWGTNVLHVIENTSEYTLEIFVSLKTYDSEGRTSARKRLLRTLLARGKRRFLHTVLTKSLIKANTKSL